MRTPGVERYPTVALTLSAAAGRTRAPSPSWRRR